MTGEATTERECPRCGTQLPEFATHCHGCSLRLDPGVAYFEQERSIDPRTASGARAAASVGEDGATEPDTRDAEATAASGTEPEPEVRYAHRTVRCLPMDLERVARVEAVDGWALLDTTVDPDRPGGIIAHLRRPARGDPGSGGGTGSSPEANTAPETDQRPSRQPRSAPTAAKSSSPDPAAAYPPKKKEEWQYLLYVGLLVLGVLVLLRLMGPVGLLVALFFLPGIIRSALGMPSRKSKRKRRRGRRQR